MGTLLFLIMNSKMKQFLIFNLNINRTIPSKKFIFKMMIIH